jgi:hypothetical protein
MIRLIGFIGLLITLHHIDAPWYCYLSAIVASIDFTYTRNGKVTKL